MMFLRARSLAMGFSGARPVVVDTMLALLNRGVTPVVREHGSLGASGDLAPLASVALVLLGEGAAAPRRRHARRRRRGAGGRRRRAGSRCGPRRAWPSSTAPTGCSGCSCWPSPTSTCCCGWPTSPARSATRPCSAPTVRSPPTSSACGRRSARRSARRTCGALLAGSAIVASHRHGDDRVQDAYSLRCTPQVHGAARDTVEHARTIAERELVSFIDNPVVLPDGRVESCGNFHGAPVAAVADFLAISIADVGGAQRAAHRPPARPDALAGPAAVPRPGRRRQLGPDDRSVHAGGDGRREPPARRARRAPTRCRPAPCRRTTSRSAGRRPASCALAVANLARILAVEVVAGSWGVDAARARCSRPPAPGPRPALVIDADRWTRARRVAGAAPGRRRAARHRRLARRGERGRASAAPLA